MHGPWLSWLFAASGRDLALGRADRERRLHGPGGALQRIAVTVPSGLMTLQVLSIQNRVSKVSFTPIPE